MKDSWYQDNLFSIPKEKLVLLMQITRTKYPHVGREATKKNILEIRKKYFTDMSASEIADHLIKEPTFYLNFLDSKIVSEDKMKDIKAHITFMNKDQTNEVLSMVKDHLALLEL